MVVHVLHGVNLGMLGVREPEVYGSMTLPELEAQIRVWGSERDMRVSCAQTDSEAEFIYAIHAAHGTADAMIVNPGAWTHYSYAIRDALAILTVPIVEVHLSEPRDREPFRHLSVIDDVCRHRVAGKGADGYREALDYLAGVPV